MSMFNTILIPVDFSVHSSFAVKLGADLARRFQASVTLLHVLDPLPFALPVEYTPAQLEQAQVEAERSLAALRLRAQTAGAERVQSEVLRGDPVSEIVRFAGRGFDLLVMGTHGRRGLRHLVLGSVTERVLRIAPCPVLTARAPEEMRKAEDARPVASGEALA